MTDPPVPVEALPQGLRELKKQRTRQQIAETARGLFVERGFDAVTVAEIAAAAEVAPTTVFNYFATKEDLLFSRIDVFEEQLLGAIRRRRADESVLDAFKVFVLAQRGLLRLNDPESLEEMRRIARVIDDSAALQTRDQQIFVGYKHSLAALLAEETSAGPDDIEPWVVANAMIGVQEGLIRYIRRRILDEKPLGRLSQDVHVQANRALDALTKGLADYAGRPERGNK